MIERYRDSDAVVAHFQAFFASFQKRFFDLVKPTAFVIYGPASAKVRDMLKGDNPTYMMPVEGFTR